MRKPSSPLRRVLAVVLSLLILPWQQPALALAETTTPGAVVAGVNPDKPREALDALDRRLEPLLALIRNDVPAKPELTAALPEDLVKLKGEYQAALDKYIEAEKVASEPGKSLLAPLITASTGQMLVGVIGDNDLGGIRKDLAIMLALEESLKRPPAEIPPGDWAAVEKGVPDFRAGMGPLSSRVEKAWRQPTLATAEVESGYRPLAEALNTSFQNLRGRAARINLDGLLVAKPQTASGDAAGALMAEVAARIPADRAALLKPQLAAVNAKLAEYLHSGKPEELQSALGEIDRLYDAAKIKKVDRVEMFERIGKAAETRAQAPAPAAASVITGASKRTSDMQSMRALDAIRLEHDEPVPAPVVGESDGQVAMKAAMAAMGHIMPDGDAAEAALAALADAGVPGTNGFVANQARALAEQLRGRAATLQNEDAREKAVAGLNAAYARIETAVVGVVLGAPDRSLDPAPADGKGRAEYDKKWAIKSAEHLAELKKVEAELMSLSRAQLGVSGSGIWGWSEAVIAKIPPLVNEADIKALEPARARAKMLVELIGSLREQNEKGTLDLTTWEDKDRRLILYADAPGGTGALGAIGKAVVQRTATERESLAKAEAILARFKSVPLSGDRAADTAALDAFFDNADTKAAAEAGNLPPMLADWVRARAFEKENAKLNAEGKAPLPRPSGMPGTDEAYSRFIVADRYDRVKAIKNPTEKQMGELHESYFAMNRAAYIALGCNPALLVAAERQSQSALVGMSHRAMAMMETATSAPVPRETVPGTAAQDPTDDAQDEVVEEAAPTEKFDPKKTAAFCAGFLQNARRPTSYNKVQFNAQKKLADEIQAFLNDNEMARAMTTSTKATAAMLNRLRSASPELREELRQRGVDVDGILKQNDRGQVLQWAAVFRQLNPADDPAWRALRDSLIGRFYGDKTDEATKAQADKLRAAASSNDAVGLAASLGDIQNPAILTSGYLSALPKLLVSERTPRSLRDRAMTFMWNGGVKKGETPPERSYAGLLLASAGQYDAAAGKPENKESAEEIKRLAALMRAVAADPSDAEKTAEALRAAGQPVYDARAVRVGMDTTKVPAEPKTEEEKRDFSAARSLAKLFLSDSESFRSAAGAEKIRRGLLGKLGGEVADAQVQNRRDQMILSASDEYQDRITKLGGVSTEMLAGRVEGSASFLELQRLAGSVKKQLAASLEMYNVTEKLSATEWGRASMSLPVLLTSAKVQSLQALHGTASPDGLTVSGWMVGIDAGDVTRRRRYQTAGVENQPALPGKQQAIVDMAGKPDAPKGPPITVARDGISYVQKDGSTMFRTHNGSYSETRARKVETLTVDGQQIRATVSMGTNAAGERIEVYHEGGKSFVLESKGSYNAAGAVQTTVARRPVVNITGIAPVQTIQVVSRENGRQAISLIERRQTGGSGETLNWTRFYSPTTKGAAYDSVGRDLVAHTQTVTIGNRRTTFDLNKTNTELDESRRRATYDITGGASKLVQTEYLAISKDADGGRVVKAVIETQRTDFAGATVIEIRDHRLRADVGDDTTRDGFGKPLYRNSINRLSADELDQAIVGGKIVIDKRPDDRGSPRVDFRVTLDREGKTNAQLGKAYAAIGRRLGAEMGLRNNDKIAISAEFGDRFSKLARFFDNQFVTDNAAFAVTASVSRGGSVSLSGTHFDAAKMRGSNVDSPQYTFMALPKDAPQRQPGLPDKEQNGIFLQQELAGVRKAANDEYVFVTMAAAADGRETVTGYFGDHRGIVKHHDYRMDAYNEKKTDGKGRWYYAADIIRDYYVDGSRVASGNVIADSTTSMWNYGGKKGTEFSNWVRNTDWGKRNPGQAAFWGGVGGGFIATMLDPVNVLMIVVPGGAAYVAGKIGTGAFKTFKIIESGVNAYFMAHIIVNTGEGVVKVVVGVVKDDVNMINEGGMAVGAAVAMGAQMVLMHALIPKPAGGKPGEPGGKPVDPATKPVDPAAKPVDPAAKPVDPAAKPVDPPAKPVDPPAKPVDPPAKPVDPPAKPVDPPGKPVDPPGKPVDPPGKPMEPPGGMPPTPTRPGGPPRLAETPGFKGSNLDAPMAGTTGGSRGGGRGELTPGGTKSAANEGAGGGGGSSPAAKPMEAAAAKPTESANKAAPAEATQARAAAESAPTQSQAREAAPANQVESAAQMIAPRPMEQGGSRGASAGEASMAGGEVAGVGRGRTIERGPIERGPVESGRAEPSRDATTESTREGTAEGGPAETGGANKIGAERVARGESPSMREGPTAEPVRSAATAEGAPLETAAAKSGVEPAGARTGERGPARGEGTTVSETQRIRESGEAQREANAFVEDGAAALPRTKPAGTLRSATVSLIVRFGERKLPFTDATLTSVVKRGLKGGDTFAGWVLKPVGKFIGTAGARLGERKLPFTDIPLSSVVGRTVNGIQTVGLGVEMVGAKLGILGSPVRSFGMMLQGRVLPHEGRPLTFEEVWHPDLAKRPSFLEAASAEVLAKGGSVAGRFNPETGRASFGSKAKGEIEIAVEVRPNGKGGVEIIDYQVKAADPKIEAQAHGEMYGQLERTYRTEQHQEGLDTFFGSKDVSARLTENMKLTGETFVDVTYDAGVRRFKLAETGRGQSRLRFEPEPSGQLRLVEAEPLVAGARLPPGADYNLRMFSARRGVSLEGAPRVETKLSLEERGARYAERLKEERVRVAKEDIERSALAEARVKGADAKLDAVQSGSLLSDPALGRVRAAARGVAELRIERELANTEIVAADKHLEALKIPKETLSRAEAALTARERAGRELDKAEAEFDAARSERPASQERLLSAQARGREAAGRFRIAEENAARVGGKLTEAGVDALVRRQAASQKIAAIEAAGRVAQRELRVAVREARGGKESPAERKAAVSEALALERLAAAEVAFAKDGAIREYRRDGLHRSTGGDGRRVTMMRLLAREGVLEGGRASVGQEAGTNLCVLATAADMAAVASRRPASGAMAEAEAAIIAHHQAKAKEAGAADWEVAGRKAGEDFLKDAAQNGMSGPEMREMMSAVAKNSGLRLVDIPAEKLFVELAAGRQVAVVMTHVADGVTGFKGGAHMVNVSNWRQARNPLTGRVETMVDVADPNVRVLTGKDAHGAPIYEARTVAMPLSQVIPEIRGSLHAENGRAAGYAFEPIGGTGTRGPPARSGAEQLARMGGSEGVGASMPVAGVKAPAGFEGRGPGKILDPNHLPVEIYSREIVEVSREHGLVRELGAGNLSGMKPGVKHNYVIVESPGGLIEMTVGRLAEGNVKEVGVKHVALGDGRAVLFSGEFMINPLTGRPKLDFNSGMYSQVGLDARWAPTRVNARALAAHAEAILKTPVEVFNHIEGRGIDFRDTSPSREGVGAAPDAARYERYFSVAEIRAAHPEPASGNVYHDWQHTVKVADMAGEFALARGLGAADAKFVSEVALLHDFDAARVPGTPARVLFTLEGLRADFAGTKSLNGEPGRSVLKERFGWNEGQLKMAEAMIQRTEFPFAEKHPNPAYAEKSPLARYTEMLEGLSPGDRRFVLREAALLSEYADKSSWYATEDFAGAFKAVDGLVREINVKVVTTGNLGTSGFLKVVGEPAAFAHDMALAKQFGVKLKLPNRAEAFKLLPEQYGRTFESNLKGFTEFDALSKAGDAAAFDRARATADVARTVAARAEGVGSAREPIPDSPTAVRLRGEQNFARTPDYPNSPVFTENSRKANDLFNRWLNGQEGNIPLREAMEGMHKLYAGKGEIGKGMGGQYMADGAASNGRAKATREFVRDYFALEANPDGYVALPGIPKEMSPLFMGTRYFYPDSSIPGMRETYYKALETQLDTFSGLVNRIETLKAKDPNFASNVEYQALVKASLDTVVDFGRTATAFRQFKNGNWGLYGPMMNSMVNRLGFSIKNPGYLDIILQGATESSLKPFFEKAMREGNEFYPKNGYDPINNKVRAPDAPALASPGPRDVPANAPAVVEYRGPIKLRIGGEQGKVLEILSRADLANRFPDVAARIADTRITHVLIDPANTGQIKGLRTGEVFELGRANPGRFELTPTVSGKHLRITGSGSTLKIEDLGSRNGTRIETGVPVSRVEGVGAGSEGGLFGRFFGAREKTPALPEKIIWPVEAGGPAPARLDFAALKLDGPLKNLEAVHTNVIAVELGGIKGVLKVDANPNEARVLAAMAEVALPANVRIPRLLGDAPADVMALHDLTAGAPGAVNYAAVKRAAAEGRHMIVVERLPDDFVSMMQVTNGSIKLQEPISRQDWQGMLDAVKALSRRGMGFGALANETNIRLRQVPDGKGGLRTEFALIDTGQGTLKGKIEVLGSDYVQLKGDRALETRLLEAKLLEGRGVLPDPRLASMARNQVPQSQKFADELNVLMKGGGGERPSAVVRAESHRFTDLAQAAAYLKAPEGITLLAKTSEGLAGDTVKVEVNGQDWYVKRVTKALGESIDDGLRSLTPRERAGNELAMREVVRRWFPETFRVAPEAIVIEHGGEIFVMTRGAPAAPAPERLQTMTAAEHADYALLRLVFRAEDLNRGNVLFGKDGKPTLIDFEKVIAAPLEPAQVARGADNEIFVKGFPVVSLKGNDMAVYRAHAERLRARLSDPASIAELTGVLKSAGWTPERTASYLKAIEINLKNFEVNLSPYIEAANKIAAKRAAALSRPEGVGAADNFFDGPPDAVRARQNADKPSPLRQVQVSLEARGKGEVFKEAEAILYTDGLTGLPNRAFIMEKAESLLKGVKDPTVAMLDMNNFGAVNAGLADIHGPVVGKEMGDGMLASAGPKIDAIARELGVNVARLGGEEIVVFGSVNKVIDFTSVMRKAFPPEKVLRDANVHVGPDKAAIDAAMVRMNRTGPMGDFTYGVARTEGRSFDAALKAADGVLNKAKAEGLRGEAVMETPGSGVSFTRLRDISTLAQRVADHGDLPPLAQRPERLKQIAELKAKLTEKEYAVFIEAVYKDPLTLTKTAEWIDMARPQWEAAYDGKGAAAMISARNFKAVNDVLGHDVGDHYLKRLGVIARVEVNRLRKLGYSVEEPVRVGGKEFLLVGKDAAAVAKLVGDKFAAKLAAGEVLPPEQMARLRAEAPGRGLIPKERVGNIGTVRAVSEPFKGGFKKTYERLILQLEAVKVHEERASVTPKPEGVGAGNLDPVALREFGRSAASHYSQPWSLAKPGTRRADGIRGGAHEESLFRAALAEAHGKTTVELPVPGYPGMTYVQYRLYQSDGHGSYGSQFKAGYFEKTIVDPKLWTKDRLAELAGNVFGGVGKDGQHRIEYKGVTFIGWIRAGKLESFGVDNWPGRAPTTDVPAAMTPVPKSP